MYDIAPAAELLLLELSCDEPLLLPPGDDSLLEDEELDPLPLDEEVDEDELDDDELLLDDELEDELELLELELELG